MHTLAGDPTILVMHESIKSLMRDITDLQDHCETLEAENTNLKQRVGVLESGQHGIRQQVHCPLTPSTNLTGYQDSETSDSGSPIPKNTELELSRLSYRVEDVEEHFEKLKLKINDLGSRETPNEGISQGIYTGIKQVKMVCQSLWTMRDMERAIDGAHSKADLYRMFRDLTDGMGDEADPAAVRTRGAFTGTLDDMVALRNRVLFCLTLFDGYKEALEEARKAEVV